MTENRASYNSFDSITFGNCGKDLCGMNPFETDPFETEPCGMDMCTVDPFGMDSCGMDRWGFVNLEQFWMFFTKSKAAYFVLPERLYFLRSLD